MDVVVIVSDSEGVTHFADSTVELTAQPFAPPAVPFEVSAPFPASHGVFFCIPAGWHGDWHPSPAHQYFVQTTGLLEVTVGDGEVRILAPGAVVLLEDLTGRGHLTRVLGDDDVSGVFVQFPT